MGAVCTVPLRPQAYLGRSKQVKDHSEHGAVQSVFVDEVVMSKGAREVTKMAAVVSQRYVETWLLDDEQEDDDADSVAVTGLNGIAYQGQHSMVDVVIQLLYHIGVLHGVVVDAKLEEGNSHVAPVRALRQVLEDLERGPQPASLRDLSPFFDGKKGDVHKISRSNSDISTIFKTIQAQLGSHISQVIESNLSIIEKTHLHSYTPLYPCSNRGSESLSMLVEVQGNKSLQESLKQYVQPNPIYENEKLESIRTRTIEHLPPVWMIDLRRHHYSHSIASMVIHRHRHEYPETLDAGPYLSNFADCSEPWIYKLHGVIVFEKPIGEEGRYLLYLKPTPRIDAWYKFDGELVVEVPWAEAFDWNFGLGRHDEVVTMRDWERGTGHWRYPKMAVTLIYVRESRLADVFC